MGRTIALRHGAEIAQVAVVMVALLAGCGAAKPAAPPKKLGLSSFYRKHLDASGLPIVASARVPDAALVEAKSIVDRMLAARPDVREALIRHRLRVAVMARSELTTDIPEHADLEPKDHWDARARGLGATSARPTCSGAEENLLAYEDDRYRGESILIHEFAHTIHTMGLRDFDARFDVELRRCYESAMSRNLFKGTYAATNPEEYWAEGVQSWFDANQEAIPANGVHNEVDTRAELERYDPDLARLIAGVFRDTSWRWRPWNARPR